MLELIRAYLAIAFGDPSIADPDEQRRPMLAPGWMYHGVDGSPVDFDGLAHDEPPDAVSWR